MCNFIRGLFTQDLERRLAECQSSNEQMIRSLLESERANTDLQEENTNLHEASAVLEKDNERLAGVVTAKQNIIAELSSSLVECHARVDSLEQQARVFDLSHWTEPLIVTGEWINEMLANKIPTWHSGAFRWPLDNQYQLATDEEIIEYILWNDLNRWQYVSEFFDCDDFGWVFRGDFLKDTYRPGKGSYGNVYWIIDWSSAHAYNLIIRRTGLWIYEPQNDRWWDTDQNNWAAGMYKFQNTAVIGQGVQVPRG